MVWSSAAALLAGDFGDVILVNEHLLEAGFAPRYSEDSLEGELLYEARLDAAEDRAKASNRGLWSACGGDG